MRPDHSLNRPRNVAIVAFLVLGLSFVAFGAATGLRRLFTDWTTTCRRLTRLPSLPGSAAPWRVTDLRSEVACLRRRP